MLTLEVLDARILLGKVSLLLLLCAIPVFNGGLELRVVMR